MNILNLFPLISWRSLPLSGGIYQLHVESVSLSNSEKEEGSMSLFQKLFEILCQEDWKFDFDKKNEIIKLEIPGINTRFHVFLLVDEKQESLLCNTYIKQKVPHSKRLEVCDFMNRANYELANGNFEMDIDNGEIRYRTFLDLADTEPSKDQIQNIVWTGIHGFDSYYRGLIKLVYWDYSAEDAMAYCTEEDS